MKVVVTGYRGFVGSHLMTALRERHDRVTGIDLRDGEDIRNCYLPPAERVYHLAAQTDAQSNKCMDDLQTNAVGTLRLLEKYGPKVVLASTSMVNYPVTPYAISKRAAEDYAVLFGAAIVRFCNLYGEGGHSAVDRFASDETITIRGSGDQLRTYAPVEDAVAQMIVARAGELVILKGRDLTVNEIAANHPGKPVKRVPALVGRDILDGRQLY